MACSVLDLHKLFGKKWTYGLFYNISDTPQSYNQLYSLSKRSINPTLLSKRLQELVALGLVVREEKDTHVFYRISDEGKKMKTLLFEIKQLSETLGDGVPERCEGADCSGCSDFKRQ